jgi:integrase
MRVPHHLVLSSTGVYHFRLKVPSVAQAALGLRVVKQSLRTRDSRAAQLYAFALALRYAHVFAEARRGIVPKPPSIDDILASVQRGGVNRFEVDVDPATRAITRMKTDGSPQDNAAALDFAKIVFASPLPPPRVAPKMASMSLGEALRLYETTEAPNLVSNTARQRARACASFVKKIGAMTPVADISRPMAAAWAAELMGEGMTKNTAKNSVSHVAQIFEMLITRGQIEKGKNPVVGVLNMSTQEKRRRKAQGYAWEAFEPDALSTIYDAANFGRLTSDHARWGSLLGLYTGARVGEIAQLYLRDFQLDHEYPHILIRADSDGQSVKTQSSERKVPLHAHLLELGLDDRVRQLRRQGATRFFPDMRIDSHAGAGNALSKAFSYYLAQLGVKPRRVNGTIGFHSLRKTAIQVMQGNRVPGELRRAFVGHELGGRDVHEENYMREWEPDELAIALAGLPALPPHALAGIAKILAVPVRGTSRPDETA